MEHIQSYTDYRAFLRDFYKDRKKLNHGFSYRVFCSTAGIKSPSLFKDIADGRRNLTPSYISAFIKGMHLNDRDAAFFRVLVKFNRAKSASEKQELLEIMRGLKPSVRQKLVPLNQYEYYSKWYHAVVREMACTMDWKGNYNLLARAIRPRITKRQARESVELLLKLGFIIKNRDGSYSQESPAVTTGSEVVSLAVRKLNQELSGMGQRAIEEVPPEKRHITSLIMGISEKSFGIIKREILDFKQRLCNIVDEDRETDRVYNINVQLFPLSEAYPKVRKKQEAKHE
jgi:uncharacterized protein (TIGR02147 family)